MVAEILLHRGNECLCDAEKDPIPGKREAMTKRSPSLRRMHPRWKTVELWTNLACTVAKRNLRDEVASTEGHAVRPLGEMTPGRERCGAMVSSQI